MFVILLCNEQAVTIGENTADRIRHGMRRLEDWKIGGLEKSRKYGVGSMEYKVRSKKQKDKSEEKKKRTIK